MSYVVYSKPSCGYCQLAKLFLESQKIEYTEIDVSSDKQALDFLKSKGFRTVPQIYSDEEYIGGYEDLIKTFE